MIPGEHLAEAIIPESHRAALITWLRSLTGNRLSVRLSWECPGLLTLTWLDNDTRYATIEVPATVTGTPPVIAFEPLYLASALDIGPALRLIDGMSPGLAIGPGGVFCVLMPMRCSDAATIRDHAACHPDKRTATPAAA